MTSRRRERGSCRRLAAAAVMRVPVRKHVRLILWQGSHIVVHASLMSVLVAVSPNATVQLRRERHTRKHEGRHIAWFVSDKYGSALLVSQKLGPLREWINARASAPHERVNLSSLYETATIGKHSQRTGGYTNGRFVVVQVTGPCVSWGSRMDSSCVPGDSTAFW